MPTIVSASSEVVYDEFTKTVTVSPSPGGDDTANIQMAFDWAVAQGAGSTVELTAGQFRCESIHVEDFYGTFTGAGRTLTTIDIIPGGAEIEDYFGGVQFSYFFYFRGGDVGCTDMKFHITPESPSNPWVWFDGPKTATSIVYIDGPTESVSFNRVDFKGEYGDWYGRNVIPAILVWSVDIFNYVEIESIVVRECTFQSLETALNIERLAHSDVEMTHCSATDVEFGLLWLDTIDVDLLMQDNLIDCTAVGMYIPYCEGSMMITDNSIHGMYAFSPIIGEMTENVVFSENHITGSFVYGVNPWFGSNGWIIEKNTFGMTKEGNIVGIMSWLGAISIELSDNCIVRKNQFYDVTSDFGAVWVYGNGNSIINNDYTQSNLLGWDYYVGCVLLDYDAQNNLVVEGLSPTGTSFPLGTSLCNQILDVPRWYQGGSTNIIAGYAACVYNPNWDRIVDMLQEKLPDKP